MQKLEKGPQIKWILQIYNIIMPLFIFDDIEFLCQILFNTTKLT